VCDGWSTRGAHGYQAEFWKSRGFRPHAAVARLKSGVTVAATPGRNEAMMAL
jgi:hypothetical protein